MLWPLAALGGRDPYGLRPLRVSGRSTRRNIALAIANLNERDGAVALNP